MRKIFFMVLILIFINLTGAYQLGVSPSEIAVSSGECKEIYVFSKDYVGEIGVNDAWSKTREKDIDSYSLNSKEIGLEVEYARIIELNGINKIKVCISGKGKYYGLILFHAKEGNMVVGSRISFNGGNGLFTGRVISEHFTPEGINVGKVVIFSSFCLSLVLFAFLVVLLRVERRREEDT